MRAGETRRWSDPRDGTEWIIASRPSPPSAGGDPEARIYSFVSPDGLWTVRHVSRTPLAEMDDAALCRLLDEGRDARPWPVDSGRERRPGNGTA